MRVVYRLHLYNRHISNNKITITKQSKIMKKVIKTSEALAAYNILNNSKYSNLEDGDKIKLWKITRALKPIATKFEEDNKDAAEKFKADIKDFDELLPKAQEYENLLRSNGDMSKSPIGAAEYDAFIKEFKKYNSLVGKAVEEFANKEVELSFEPLSEDAISKLMASNTDWKMEQVMAISDIVCDVAAPVDEEPKKGKKK